MQSWAQNHTSSKDQMYGSYLAVDVLIKYASKCQTGCLDLISQQSKV